jgi:hypothetical protein
MSKNQQESVLTLTDDEVVAIAIAAKTFYPGDLPTVDAESEQALLQASLRGRRSLVARGWVTEDGELAAALALAGGAAGATRFINVFLGDEELNRLDWNLATSLYPDESSWLIEGVEGTGLHRFAAATEQDARSALHALVTAAFSGADAQPLADGAWLMVSVLHETESRLLATRPGAYRTTSIHQGHLTPWNAAAPGDIPGWIDAALASVGQTTSRETY